MSIEKTQCDGCWNHWRYMRRRGPEPLTEEPPLELLAWYAQSKEEDMSAEQPTEE